MQPILPVAPPTVTPLSEEHSVIIPPPLFKVRTAKQQSFGTIISILIIVGMVVVGAFYAWGKRIAQNHVGAPQTSSSTQSY